MEVETVSADSTKLGLTQKVKKFGGLIAIVATAAVVGLMMFFGVFNGLFAKKEEEPQGPPPLTEEEKQMLMIQQREREKQGMRDAAYQYKIRLSRIMQDIETNQFEAKANHEKFQKLFGTKKSSFDDDLTNMEDEQNLDTVFMVKDDIDKKKAGMVNLGRELGLQYNNLKEEFANTEQYLVNLNEQWMQMYPGEEPLYQKFVPNKDNIRPPISQEKRMAMQATGATPNYSQNRQSNFTGDPVLSNDMGREQLPFS